MRGNQLKGALAAAPKGGRVTSLPVGRPNFPTQSVAGVAQGAGLQRVSPGVYRNPQGQLVKGNAQQPQRPPMQVPQPKPQQPGMHTLPYNFPAGTNPGAIYGAIGGAQAGMQQQPSGQYGYGEPLMQYAGGSANFNEQTGQYNDPARQAALLAQKQAYAQQFNAQTPFQQQQTGQSPQPGMQYGMTGQPLRYTFDQGQS